MSKKKLAATPLPEGAKKLPHTRLAEGEATGHYHEAVGDDVSLWDLGEEGGVAVLDAPKGATVTHQEHGEIKLPARTYDKRIVQEYDHASEEARRVVD